LKRSDCFERSEKSGKGQIALDALKRTEEKIFLNDYHPS